LHCMAGAKRGRSAQSVHKDRSGFWRCNVGSRGDLACAGDIAGEDQVIDVAAMERVGVAGGVRDQFCDAVDIGGHGLGQKWIRNIIVVQTSRVQAQCGQRSDVKRTVAFVGINQIRLVGDGVLQGEANLRLRGACEHHQTEKESRYHKKTFHQDLKTCAMPGVSKPLMGKNMLAIRNCQGLPLRPDAR